MKRLHLSCKPSQKVHNLRLMFLSPRHMVSIDKECSLFLSVPGKLLSYSPTSSLRCFFFVFVFVFYLFPTIPTSVPISQRAEVKPQTEQVTSPGGGPGSMVPALAVIFPPSTSLSSAALRKSESHPGMGQGGARRLHREPGGPGSLGPARWPDSSLHPHSLPVCQPLILI